MTAQAKHRSTKCQIPLPQKCSNTKWQLWILISNKNVFFSPALMLYYQNLNFKWCHSLSMDDNLQYEIDQLWLEYDMIEKCVDNLLSGYWKVWCVLLQADGERFIKMLCNQSITKNTVAFRFWKGKSEQTSRLSNLTSTGSLAQHKRSFFTKSSVSTLTSKPKSSRPLTMAGISACKPAAKAWATQKKEQDFFA